jgi:hypothetical protein
MSTKKGKIPAYSRQSVDVTFSATSELFYRKTIQCLVTNVGLLSLTLSGQCGRESLKGSIQEATPKNEFTQHLLEFDNGGKLYLSDASLNFGFVDMTAEKVPKPIHLTNSTDQTLKISISYDKLGYAFSVKSCY